MLLSDLIDFRNQLEKIVSKEAKVVADRDLEIIKQLVKHPQDPSIEPLTFAYNDNLQTRHTEIMQAFDNFYQEVQQVQQRVRDQIAEQEKYWFQESYRLYEEEMCYDTAEHVLGRRPILTTELEEIFQTRLGIYNDWRCPGLIIRPGEEKFINSLVAYDPLYIVDESYDLLQPALNQFPPQYQRRLRTYVVEERKSDIYLDKIPNNQFGICFVYNFFNFKPFEVIKQYLQEIYTKLRPGGALIMTYNDCDIGHAVRSVERHYACYTPGYLVQELAQSIGFEQTFIWKDGNPSVWIEFRKPGELSFLRGGQATATIEHINNYLEDVDFIRRRPYTSEELEAIRREEELHEKARQHGIDPLQCANEEEIIKLIAETIEHNKKEELKLLVQRALELQVGDVELIKYGYSAEKLKQLISEKESK